jgi:hypothetical protein
MGGENFWEVDFLIMRSFITLRRNCTYPLAVRQNSLTASRSSPMLSVAARGDGLLFHVLRHSFLSCGYKLAGNLPS